MRAATGLTALALAAVAAGCGSSGGTPRTAGRSLFTTDCGFCHSLSGHQSPSRQGGDLLRLHMSRTAMIEFVREMPVRHRLTSEQVSAIARYVQSVEAGRRPG